MPRRGSTHQRGYGWPHQKRARELKAALRDGDLCARGGEPLYRWQLTLPRGDPRGIHADHVSVRVAHDETALPDALSCGFHNMSHGGRMAAAERAARNRGAATRGGTSPIPRDARAHVRDAGLPRW
jgi:hypothetical protein